MDKSSDIYSVSSSLLDDENLKLKRHNERIGAFFIYLGNKFNPIKNI